YFYAVEKDDEGAGLRVLDALHIREVGENEEWEEDEGPEEDASPENEDPKEEESEYEESEEQDAFPEDDEPSEEEPDEEPEEDAGEEDEPVGGAPADLKIIWSRDWLKCALVLDGYVHAIFDFENQGGYNINEFPPPNSIWTQGDRKLTPELIQRFF
ncbi:MAG TPA: DUF2251 domain-containing protein, partial [Puia sp.]|nr:DUF2251 domain-containing protein [Puia sp.]